MTKPTFTVPAVQYLRVMLRVVSVRYLLTPFGMTLGHTAFREHGRVSWFKYREAYVFGVRVARWVVEVGPPTITDADFPDEEAE